jgi:uncharacterized protein YndB with AHSA1/START domain
MARRAVRLVAEVGRDFGSGLIEPIRRSIRVGRPRQEVFALFSARMTDWWPTDRFTFAPGRSHEVIIEPRVGGRFYERYRDLAEFTIGQVLAWEPPERIAFTWQSPSWPAPTRVSVQFIAEEPAITRVDVEHSGWELLGAAGQVQRDGYANGWPSVLAAFAKVAGLVN